MKTILKIEKIRPRVVKLSHLLLSLSFMVLFSCSDQIDVDSFLDSDSELTAQDITEVSALVADPFFVGDLELLSIGDTQVRVEFTSSQNSQAYIEYGKDMEYGGQTKEEQSFRFATHRQNILDLEPNTTYFYRVNVTSEDGERATASASFTTAGDGSGSAQTPFTVSGLEVIILEETEARIQFTASTNAQAFIEYGLDTDYGSQTPSEESFRYAEHRQWVRDIVPGTTYFYRVRVTNQAGETASASSSFTTPGGDIDPPIDPPVEDPVIVIIGEPVSYGAIAAGAPATSCLITDNEYLAEFLRQNPEVAFWQQNGGTITAIEGPQDSDYAEVVTIRPSGGNDTQAIVNALNDLPENGVLDGGNQVFRVISANLTAANASGKTIRNMRVIPNSVGNTTVFTISAPDVSFINVHIDAQNRSILHGFSVRASADRFSFVNGSIEDVLYTGTSTAGALRIYNGVDDIYVVNNIFRNLIADNPAPATARMRGIWFAGDPVNGQNSRGGITASNLFENLQSNGQGDDADAFVVQGFGDDSNTSNTFQPNDRHLFLANVGIDAGKRIMKAQSGGVDVHSNFNHWKTPTGPVGTRVTRGHYIFHGGSYHRVTNNLAITDFVNPDSESFFTQFQTHRHSGEANESTDIVFNCNSYTHNANGVTSRGESSYAFLVYDALWNGRVTWPKNSEMNNNHVDGSGELRYHYWFRIGTSGGAPNDPGDPRGTQFEHENNTISVPFDVAEFRPDGNG